MGPGKRLLLHLFLCLVIDISCVWVIWKQFRCVGVRSTNSHAVYFVTSDTIHSI